MTTLKILFITHVKEMAGANRSMFQLIKEMKEDYGVTVVVLTPESEDPSGTIQIVLRKIGVNVIKYPIWFFKRENPTFRNIIGYARYLWRSRYLQKLLKEYHFDIIHSNSSVIDIGGYLSRKLRAKHVWHLREFGDLDYNLKPIGGKLYERYTYQHADAFIAISHIIADHYKKIIPPRLIHTIYNGVFFPKNTKISTHDNQIIQFFCAGVICEGKNQKEIVLAIDELVNIRKETTPFHLTIVGIQTQPYTNELITLIKEKNLSNYIDILPEVDGIQSLAANMDVGIVPSKAEAFGRVTIEYQLQNLLVIANDAGANTELIENDVTGLIYSSEDPCALADCMQKIIKNRMCLINLAVAGMANAKKHFLSEHNTQSIYRLYQTLLN